MAVELTMGKPIWRFVLLTAVVVTSFMKPADGACGDTIGTSDPSAHVSNLGTNTGFMFFEVGAVSDCCGFLTTVQVYTNSTGSVDAMIWRPTSGTNYKLVAEKTIPIPAAGTSSLAVADLAIAVGDVVGWYTSGTEIIPHSMTAGGALQSQLRGSVSVNTDVSWGLAGDSTRTYAWGVTTTANAPPVGTPTTVTVADNESPGTVVHTVTVTDTDTSDTHTFSMSASSQFSFNPTSGEISVSGTLSVGPETVTITASDACDTITFDITLDVKNNAPVFTSGCSVVTTPLSDATTTQVKVHTFQVTDSDLQQCIFDPAQTNFEIRDNAPNKEIWTTSTASLDFDTVSQYTLLVVCNDVSNPAVTCSVTVTLADEPPTLTVPGTTLGPLSDLIETQTLVGSFTLTDTAADTSRLSCQFNPANSDFSITAGTPPNYDINLNAANSIDYDAGSTVTLTLECSDTQNTETGTVSVLLEDGQPMVTGLPFTYTSLSDGVQTGVQLEAVTCTDRNDPCSCSLNSTTYFEIKNSVEVWVKDGVDIPTTAVPQIDLLVSCTDGDTAAVTGIFTVEIQDAAPTFVAPVPSVYATSVSDGINYPNCFDTFTVSDPDVTCDLNPANANYVVEAASPQVDPPEFSICLSPTAVPNFDVEPSAVLTLSCTDGVNPAITTDYTINYFDDPPVLVSGLNATYTGVSDSDMAEILLGSFSVTDTRDVITCAFDPLDARFEVRAVAATTYDFEVYKEANAALSVSDSPISLLVSCTDQVTNGIITGTVTVELINGSPTFTNLPITGAPPTISEAVTTKTCVYTVSATDSTALFCYLESPSSVPGIIIEKVSSMPGTTTYDVCVQGNAGLSAAANPLLNILVSCTDYSTVVTETLPLSVTDAPLTITSGACSATILETDETQVDIYTITLSETGTCTLTNDGGGIFALDGLNLVKTAGLNLDFEMNEGYSLTYDCSDGPNSVSGSCDITITNVGPRITNDRIGLTILEGQKSERNLITFTTSEPASNCYETPTATAGFVTKIVPSTPDWAHFFEGTSPLDYEANKRYFFDIVCEDSEGAAGNPFRVQLTVLKNKAPEFTTIPDSVSINAVDTPDDTLVHTLAPTDNENDPITISLTSCSPTPCLFNVLPNGEVKSNADLELIKERKYTLCIALADDYNDVPCEELIIDIKPNDPPEISNMELIDSIPVYENSGIGTVIYDVDFTDDDPSDTHTFTCTFDDGGGDYILCDPTTGEFKVNAPIDFETIGTTQFIANVVVNDGHEDSVSRQYLLQIHDVFEPPSFVDGPYTITKPDEGTNDRNVGCPSFSINDEDRNDVHSYKMACPSPRGGHFVMDKETGCITMSSEWDLDPGLESDSITCTAHVYDLGNLTDSTQITITVTDENDEPPILDQTSYDSCIAVGSTGAALNGATSTDDDTKSQNTQHTYSLVGGDASAITVDGNGNMQMNANTDTSGLSAGTEFLTTLRVEDGSGLYDEAKVSVTVCEPIPTPPVTTVNPATTGSATSGDSNIIWIALLGILGAIGLAVLAFMLYWCWRNGKCCCRSAPGTEHRHPPVRQVTPERPPESKPGTIAPLNLPIHHYYARNVHNIGAIRTIHTVRPTF